MDQSELLKKIADLSLKIIELEKDLIHDSLTFLKTRRFFEEEVRRYLTIISGTTGSGQTLRHELFGFKNLSIVFFDIDLFKRINDTYGHECGDKALRLVAKTIADSIRVGDTAARWGGEEFIVSLLGATEVDAKNKAEEIRKKVEALKFDFDPDLKITISAGVVNEEVSVPYEELFRRVDRALYSAKETGRNKVVTFSEI